ncbi:potassium channel family protein [Undibacterium arcticum]
MNLYQTVSSVLAARGIRRNGMKKLRLSWPERPMLLIALILSIPAFYLVLTGAQPSYRSAGHWLYGVVATMMSVDILVTCNRGQRGWVGDLSKVDLLVLLGALASTWPTESPWSNIEWLLRLGYCGVVFIRLATLLAKYVAPHRLLQIVTLAVFVLAIAGAGFFWLEPKVHTYADGVWLAFITGATVGYGDLVPSTPASRIFAAFIVLLGYALFSVVTASIAALLVGEDEKRFMRGLHSDMRMLREEIAALRAGLRDSLSAPNSGAGENKDKN